MTPLEDFVRTAFQIPSAHRQLIKLIFSKTDKDLLSIAESMEIVKTFSGEEIHALKAYGININYILQKG